MGAAATTPRDLARRSGEELIAHWRRTGDRRARERAVESYMPLARRLAARYQRRSESLDDLTQVAYLGLVNAIDRFDPERGTRFSSFAIPTISGELRRHFRSTAWALHVPRGTQEAVLAVTQAGNRLATRLGRSPTVRELAEETGLDPETIAEALQASSAQSVTSLDQPRAAGGGEDDVMLCDVVGADDARFDLVEHTATVAPLLRALPQREREVLFLRFARDMTQSEIAARVGCSQMHISRLLRRAIARLSEVADEA